jgi:transposase
LLADGGLLKGQAGGGGCDDAGGLGGNALDKRKKRTSNKEWMSPTDRDARITKMKDGRTHLAHKAEQAVDLDTGAVVAVTLREADKDDTTTLDRTLFEAR